MIKNKIVLEQKIGERAYEFYCNPDSPLGEVHDVLHMMKDEIIKKMQEATTEIKNEECKIL